MDWTGVAHTRSCGSAMQGTPAMVGMGIGQGVQESLRSIRNLLLSNPGYVWKMVMCIVRSS